MYNHKDVLFQVSFTPYFYELVFYKSVLFNGVFLISDGDLIIELTKEEAGIWSQLGGYPKKNEAKEFREKAEEDFRNFYNKDILTSRSFSRIF